MEFSMEDSESALVQLIEVLGNTLARLQATYAKEEYELEQIVASIKFVNHRNKSSQEPDPESPDSDVHVHESDLSEVSKSIDAILDEARSARSISKSSANRKGPSSTPRDASIAETQARKSKAAAVQKKKLERVTQPVRRKPRKAVSSLEDEVRSSIPAAKEMLLRWMENKKDGSWIDKHVERRQNFDRKITEKSNAEKRFLDRLWSIRSIPPDSLTNVEDGAAGDGKDDPNATEIPDEIQRMTKRILETNRDMSQAQWKLMNERHLNGRSLEPGQDFPFMSKETQHEKKSAADDDCWLSAEICEKVLGTEFKGLVSKPGTQEVPIVKYSDLQEALKMTELMHSIRSNIFNCYIQSLLAESLLKASSPLATRSGEDIINNPSLYLLFRLAHCLVCNNGKALLTIARRVEVSR